MQIKTKFYFLKWGNPGLFWFIFVLFKHNFYRKNCKCHPDSNSDDDIEGEHSDHLTTTTAQSKQNFMFMDYAAYQVGR